MITVEIIKTVSIQSNIAVSIAAAEDTAEYTDFILLSPRISEAEDNTDNDTCHRIHSVRTGRNKQAEAIITNTPVPDLSSSKLPLNVVIVSLRTPPTTGTKELTAKRIALWLTLSSEDVTKLWAESTVAKILITSVRSHFVHLYKEEHKTERFSFGESDEVKERARNVLSTGVKSLDES